MRIALVYDAIYPYVKGGGEKRLFLLAQELAKRHEVHMFGMRWWREPATFERKGVIYHGVCKAVPLYTKGRRSLLQPAYFSLFLAHELWKYNFDIVDCQSFPFMPAFVCKAYTVWKRKKLVLTWYEFWGRYWLRYLGVAGIVGIGVERMATVLTKNHGVLSRMTQKRLPKKSALLPMGIVVSSFARVHPARVKVDVLFVGRLIKEKNILLLLHALALLPNITCGIVGDGPERKILEKECAGLGLSDRVVFFDFLPEREVFALMKAARVFVFPSVREGFGLAALEALACGCPVVALKRTSISEFVQDGVNGFLCENNADDVAGKVKNVFQDRMMRVRARESARKFDIQKVIGKVEEYYKLLQ